MTKWLFLAMCVLSLTLTPPQGRLVRVGVYNNAPLVFVRDGRAQGFYIDLLEQIAAEEEWKLQYVQCKWLNCLSMLERGEIDLLVDIAHTEERENRFDFNRETVLSNWGQVYARRGSGIQSLLDLDGRRVAVVQGDVYYESLATLVARLDVNCRFVKVNDYGQALELVAEGKADAGLVSRLYGLEHEREYRTRRTPVLCCPVELRFAAPRGRNSELLEVLDRHLAEMKDDPNSAYYRAMNRWFGGLRAGFPAWLKWLLIGLSGLAVLLSIGIAVMRIQVQARTRELEARHASLQAVHMVADAVYRSLNLHEVAQRAVEAMIRYTHSPSVGLFLCREEGCLEPLHIYGIGEAVRRASARLDLRRSLSGRAVIEKQVMVSVNLRDDERLNPRGREALTMEGYATLISVPLLVQERAVGVMDLAFKETHQPSEEEVETLRAIGQTVGLAIENAMHVAQLEAEIAERKRIEDELQQYAERLETLREIDRAILEARSSAEIAIAALERAHRLIPYLHGSVILFDLEEQAGTILALHVNGRAFRPLRCGFKLSEFIGDVAQLERGEVQMVEEYSENDTSPLVARMMRKVGVNAFLNVPLLARGEMIGALSLGLARRTGLERHIQVAREIADQLAVALQQARLHERLERYTSELEARVQERTCRLAESEARYRQLVESPLIGIYQADPEGRLLFVNRRLAEMGGYTLEEIVGHVTMLDVIIPELRPWLVERMRRRETDTLSPDVVEAELVRKDGSRLTVLIAPAAMYDYEGNFAGFIGAVMDITERKQLQEELARQLEEQRRLLNLMAGREIRMAELKRVVRTLREQLLKAGLEPAADDPISTK